MLKFQLLHAYFQIYPSASIDFLMKKNHKIDKVLYSLSKEGTACKTATSCVIESLLLWIFGKTPINLVIATKPHFLNL